MAVTNGSYSPLPGAQFELHDFDADMLARGKASPLCFERTTEIKRGSVFVSSDSLTKLFAQKVGQSQSGMSDVKVETHDDGTAKISGKMKKKIEVPFEIDGPVSTDGKNLILQAKKIKAEKLPIKGLLDMFGENLGKLMGSASVKGVIARGDTLIFQPREISHAEGHIAAVSVGATGMTVRFGEAPKAQQ